MDMSIRLYVFYPILIWYLVFHLVTQGYTNDVTALKYTRNPAPDDHRCGVCPTYHQKICAFDQYSNSTFIFDNHCIMDLYNCLDGTEFTPLTIDRCLFFGNFAYVHGFKYEDQDYDETNIVVKGSKKNPDFVKKH